MESTIERYKKLHDVAEKQKSQRERIKGSMDQIAKSLKQKGLNSIKESIAKIKALAKEKEQKEKLLNKKLTDFEAKYEEHL